MNTNVLTDILSKIEDPIVLSVILLLVVFLFLFKNEIASKLFAKRRKIKVMRGIDDLRNHDVFTTLQRVGKEVDMLKFYTSGEYDSVKTKMCEDFTYIKAEVCSKYMAKFLDYGIEDMDRDRLKKTILDLQHEMHTEYVEEIRRVWLARKIKAKDVDYVIELFEKFRYDVVKSFENRINSIFASANYNNNFALTLAVFEMWAMGIDLLPRDMETTFENLNGKFKDIKYER
jgi:hypothetical protein